MVGKLFLIPAPIYDDTIKITIPDEVLSIINTLEYFIVENVRTARRYLIKSGINKAIDDIHFYTLNKHTKPEEIPSFLAPVKEGKSIGLLSEAGIPCVADPGAVMVNLAHKLNINVVPLTGPSSIILALMASGLNGQNFSFVGYLPINKQQKIKRIKQLERISSIEDQTQLCIEAPYRNNHLFQDLLLALSPDSLLCIASDITSPNEYIKTKTVKEWKKQKLDINKRPTIFLFHG